MRSSDKNLVEWCKSRPKIFRNPAELVGLVQEITKKHPTLVASPHKKYEIADPYLISLAIHYKRGRLTEDIPVIVTDENASRTSGIPYVAKTYDISACKLLHMFKKEKWRF